MIVPGRVPGRGAFAAWRRELASLRLARARGSRLVLGFGPLEEALRALRPEVVLLHDSFWATPHIAHVAHELGAVVVAVRHEERRRRARAPVAERLWRAAMRASMRRVADEVDAVMSASPCADCVAAHRGHAGARVWADGFEAEVAALARLAAARSHPAAGRRGLAAVSSRN